MSAPGTFNSTAAAFFGGVKSAWTSVFFLVLAGTYIGMGALAHDYGFSSWWLALSSILVWAAPAQVILISSLGLGATPIEAAIAVGLSAIRLFPMVVALLPLLRGPGTRLRDLLLPTHFTSVSMWVESLRLLPSLARERRIAFCNGLSVGYMGTAATFGFELKRASGMVSTSRVMTRVMSHAKAATARSICSLVMTGTLEASVVFGSPVVLGKLQAAGVPVTVEIGAPPSVALGGVTVLCSRVSMARIDVRCWSMLCLSSVPTTLENRLRSPIT